LNLIRKIMDDEKTKAVAQVAGISTAGGAAGAAIAAAAGIAFAAPIAIGAGIGCLTYGIIKLVKKD
jgi:uncharacterized membrane protein